MELAGSVDMFDCLDVSSHKFWQKLESSANMRDRGPVGDKLDRSRPEHTSVNVQFQLNKYSSSTWMKKIASLRVHRIRDRQCAQIKSPYQKRSVDMSTSSQQGILKRYTAADMDHIQKILRPHSSKRPQETVVGQESRVCTTSRSGTYSSPKFYGENIRDIFQLMETMTAEMSASGTCPKEVERTFKLNAYQKFTLMQIIAEATDQRQCAVASNQQTSGIRSAAIAELKVTYTFDSGCQLVMGFLNNFPCPSTPNDRVHTNNRPFLFWRRLKRRASHIQRTAPGSLQSNTFEIRCLSDKCKKSKVEQAAWPTFNSDGLEAICVVDPV